MQGKPKSKGKWGPASLLLQGRGRTRPFRVLEGRLNPFVLAKVKGRGPCHCSFEGIEGPHLPLSVKRRPAPSFVNNIGKGPPLCSLKGEGGGPVPSFVLRSNGPAFVFFRMRRDAIHFSCEGRVGPCLLLSAKGEPSPFVVSKVTAKRGTVPLFCRGKCRPPPLPLSFEGGSFRLFFEGRPGVVF